MANREQVQRINELYSIKCELFPRATMDWFMRNWHHYLKFKASYEGKEVLFQLEQGIDVNRKNLTQSHLTPSYTCPYRQCPQDPIPLIWVSYL